MISLQLSSKPLLEHAAQGYVLFLEENFTWSPFLQKIAATYFLNLEALFKERSFTGKAQSVVVIPVVHHQTLKHLIVIGLGMHHKCYSLEYYRRAIGKAVRIAEQYMLTYVAIDVPDAQLLAADAVSIVEQTVVAAHMAAYHFDEFKSDRSTKTIEFTLCVNDEVVVQHGFKRGHIIATAVNTTRHWVDTPPSRLTPTILAEKATSLARAHHLKATVFGEDEIIKMGMGGLAAVSAGSNQDCKLIILEYHVHEKAPTIALVGKGITFDSGGLNIKPSASMATMKEDMAGAGAVINTIAALAQLKVPVNVVALAPTSENLPSGTATKPGDIVRFYNGKTAEVLDTDAEGRLILADALSYAVKHYKPDFIIDIATLTGACDYACGPFFSGMFSVHDEQAQYVVEAAARTGDLVWRLPYHEDYETAVKSEIADLRNISKPAFKAGSTTAAYFLKHFVDQTPWVHLDIASTAFDMPNISYYESGATGSGVRLMIDVVMHWPVA
jgi:leucyl aminopeptidase